MNRSAKRPSKPRSSDLSSASEIARLKQKGIPYYYEKGRITSKRTPPPPRVSWFRSRAFPVGMIVAIVFLVWYLFLRSKGAP